MSTAIDSRQIDQAQESALRCAQSATGSTRTQRQANCEVCCYTEYGLKNLYRAPRTPWSEGVLEACLQACTLTDAYLTKEKTAAPMPRLRWERGSWEHQGAETPFGDEFLTWPVDGRCMNLEHDTAQSATHSRR